MSVHSRLAACIVFTTLGPCAFAQLTPPPALGSPPHAQAGPASPVVSGRIQRWLINPNGEVDGLLLADGTQVSFPPHLSAAVQQLLKPGDTVQVSGRRAANAPVVRAATLTADSGRSVSDQPPAPDAPSPPPREPGALTGALTAMSADGQIAREIYTDRGDVNGVVLDDGTIVRFPPQAGAQLAMIVQPGGKLYAKGWGSSSASGNALEATAIGSTSDDLHELFARPNGEQAGLPRGPREERLAPAPTAP